MRGPLDEKRLLLVCLSRDDGFPHPFDVRTQQLVRLLVFFFFFNTLVLRIDLIYFMRVPNNSMHSSIVQRSIYVMTYIRTVYCNYYARKRRKQ